MKGNILTFVNPVFDATNQKRVGHDEGFCTCGWTSKQGIWECLWTTFLKAARSPSRDRSTTLMDSVPSVTGGTGAYRNARGEMVLKSRNGGKEYDFIFKLS